MNALVWMTMGLAIGWVSNTLGAQSNPPANARTLALAVAGAAFAGWMFAPTGSALSLRPSAYSAGAHLACVIGAALTMLIVHGLRRLLRPPARARRHAYATHDLAAAAPERAGSASLADTGPETVPGAHRFGADDLWRGSGA